MDERTVAAESHTAEQVNEGNQDLSVASAVDQTRGGISKKGCGEPAAKPERVAKNGSRPSRPRKVRPRRSSKGRGAKRSKVSLLKESLYNWYRSIGCLFCGEQHPAVIDLHHPRPNERGPVRASVMVRDGKYSIHDLRKELQDTIPMCSNCHRKLHWRALRHKWAAQGERLLLGDHALMKRPMEPKYEMMPIEMWRGWDRVKRLDGEP